MILHESSVIKLNYTPATDILEVDYPDMQDILLPQIRHSLTLMVEAIRNYDVKRLLLDASTALIEVSEEENRKVTMQLIADLAKTRLQKVARIQPVDTVRETRAQENISRAKQAGVLPYQVQTFVSRGDAMAWLTA